MKQTQEKFEAMNLEYENLYNEEDHRRDYNSVWVQLGNWMQLDNKGLCRLLQNLKQQQHSLLVSLFLEVLVILAMFPVATPSEPFLLEEPVA